MPTAELAPTPTPAPTLAPSPTQLPLTAGVELECGIRGRAGNLTLVRNAFRDAGLLANTYEDIDHIYNNAEPIRVTYGAWLIGTDCTSGGEMKSPIMSTVEDLQHQITKACEILTRLGYTVTPSCGLHVHLGTGAKTNAEVSRFNQFLYRNEDNFFRLVPRTRRGNNYCDALLRSYLGSMGTCLAQEEHAKVNWGQRPWFHFSNKHTTEVRLQLGSLDPERIISWVCFLQQCWRSSQVDKSYDPKWRVIRMIDRLPADVLSGFSTPALGTRTAMQMIRSKHHDEIYRQARTYAHNYAAVP